MAIALANDDVTNSVPRRVNGTDALVWTTDTGGPSNTGSFTPGANSLLCCIMLASVGTVEDPTSVVGNGATYSKKVTQDFSGMAQIHLWVADSGSSPSAGTTTATWGTTNRTGNIMYVIEFTGVDLSSGALASIVQTVGANGASTAQQLTLAAAGDATNRSVSAFGHAANEGITPDADAGTWVEIHDQGHGSPNRSFMVQWRSDAFDTDHDASWTTSSNMTGLAFEIKAAGGGGGAATVLDPFGMSGFFGA